MARTGLYKSEVRKARDTLLRQGRHPSVDAVRIELGNTGSKTTIHKYLRELEDEDEHRDPRVPVSEVIQDLVTRLAAQLQTEADAGISAVRAQSDALRERLTAELGELRQAHALVSARLAAAQSDFSAETAAHRLTSSRLQEQSAAQQTLELHGAVLKERLESEERHCRAVEEQRGHLLATLEHSRAEHDAQQEEIARRHEHQLDALRNKLRQLQQEAMTKQEEIVRTHQDAIRLASDLAHVRTTLGQQQALVRQAQKKTERLNDVLQQKEWLEAQLHDRNALIAQLQSQCAALGETCDAGARQLHACELALAAATARHDAQQSLSRELRGYLTRTKKMPAR